MVWALLPTTKFSRVPVTPVLSEHKSQACPAMLVSSARSCSFLQRAHSHHKLTSDSAPHCPLLPGLHRAPSVLAPAAHRAPCSKAWPASSSSSMLWTAPPLSAFSGTRVMSFSSFRFTHKAALLGSPSGLLGIHDKVPSDTVNIGCGHLSLQSSVPQPS